jgi:hypothetical protein
MKLLLLALLLAQTHDWPAPRDNATAQEKCKDSCRKQHCDQWVACTNLDDATVREQCKERTVDDEQRCKRKCEQPKAMRSTR